MSAMPLSLVAACRRRGTGLLSLVASGVMLGTGGPIGRLLGRVTGLSPVAVAGYRLATGGALILVILAVTSTRPPRKRVGGARLRQNPAPPALPRGRAAWTRIAVVGALAAGYQVCFFAAASMTSVSLATLVTVGAMPVLVSILEWATGRRRPGRRDLYPMVLALMGLGLLVGQPAGGPSAVAALAGTGLAVASAAGFAVVSLVAARPVPGLGDLATTGFAFTLGGLLLLPVAGLTVGVGFRPGAVAAGLLAGLAAVPTAAAYTLYFRGVRAAGAGAGALITLLEPLTGAVLAALLLGDRLGARGIAGGALLVVAVVARAARGAGAGGGTYNGA
jgi:drug/metabolite transporter, DME family